MMRRSPTARTIDGALLRRWPLPKLGRHADKVSRGDVLIVAGSIKVPGAALLAGTAALRAGAGRVQLVVPRSVATACAIAFPEAYVVGGAQTPTGELSPRCAARIAQELGACRSLLVGPGMQGPAVATRLMSDARRAGSTATIVLDAGALETLCDRNRVVPQRHSGIVATPHAGEMARIWGCAIDEVHAAPLALAREAASKLGITLVLKGSRTFVVNPDGTAFQNVAGNVGLATAGSGDTLAGLIAGLCARGAEPAQAAVWAVYLHAKAGEACARALGTLGYLARELAPHVPRLLARVGPRPRY